MRTIRTGVWAALAVSAELGLAMGAAAGPPPATERPGPVVEQLQAERQVKWQMVEARFEELVAQARQAINAQRFDEALRAQRAAGQVVEAGRQWAASPDRYERLRLQADSLGRFIAEEQQTYETQRVEQQREEARRAETERMTRERQAREAKVNQLMELALRYRKEKLYDQAVETLRQVLAVDPGHERARWMRSDLEDIARFRDQYEVRRTMYGEQQQALADVELSKVPWTKDIMYPSNWRELSARREPFGAAEASESEADRETHRRLQQSVPEIRFEAIGFEAVVDFLRDLQGLNIHVNWKALEAAGIDRDTEITTKLRDVRFEKALGLILDDVGGGDIPLGYVIDEGVIQISTRDDLNRKTVTRVFDIRDLIVRIPQFGGAPSLELASTESGGEGGTGTDIWGDDEDEDDEEDVPGRHELITQIMDLLRQTIDPDSWRENGGSVGSLRELNGQLIVTQTGSAQRQLLDLLRE